MRDRVSDGNAAIQRATLPAGTPGEVDSCLARTRQALPTLDGARRRVAEYILAHPWEARGLSIVELAQRAGVSENAISRLTRTLGYSGYRAFSQALSMDLGKSLNVYHSHPIEVVQESAEDADGLTKLIARVFALEIACMQDTLANLAEPLVQRAITSLAEARRVLLVGTGSAAPLCQMAQYRFSNIGVRATWTADPMVMVAETTLLEPGDVALGVSHSGRSRATTQTLEYARSRGVTTIALTADRSAPINEVADLALIIFGPQVPMGTAQFSARVAGMVLLEALATAIAVKKYGETPPHLHELSEAQARLNDLGSPRRTRKRRAPQTQTSRADEGGDA